jgi:hypothetical protein
MATHRRSVVFRLGTPEPVRLWSGPGNLATPADFLDPGGAIYRGGYDLISIPALKQLMNGVGDRIEIALSGVSARLLPLLQEERADVRNAPVHIGYVLFDRHWQITGPPSWDWVGVADMPSVASQDTDRGRERTITLSVRSADTMRANPPLAYYTPQDQRRRSSTDAMFDYVPQINSGVSRRFGPK